MFIKNSNRKKITYTCIPEKVSAYHTGSAFKQHYYACRVSFTLKARTFTGFFTHVLTFDQVQHAF